MRILVIQRAASGHVRRLTEEVEGLDVVAELEDGSSAPAAIRRHRPDVVVVERAQVGVVAAAVPDTCLMVLPREGGALPSALRALLGTGAAPATQTAPAPFLRRAMARVGEHYEVFEVDDACCLQAAGNYVRFVLRDRSRLVPGTLADFERRLDPGSFVRVHRSTILNLRHLEELKPWFSRDLLAILTNGESLRVSRTYRHRLDRLLGWRAA